MGATAAGATFIASLIVALAVAYRPLGDYMYRAITATKHWRAERLIYRAVGVNPDGEQTWGVYARSVLAFSAVSILFLYLFQRLQNHLWLSLGFALVAYVMGGAAQGLKNVLIRTLIHERVPERLHGRAYAAYNAARNGAELGALGLGGVLVGAAGAQAALALAGAIPLGIALVALALTTRPTTHRRTAYAHLEG